ncbi:hypothetical protein [Micromonospora carbonacea]|uniref:Uncharacterized protein n=1 Tax=Micromonospora carbonacea TaxID=47853 RepID=A0A7H8XDU1_9ACTN|nr:hypothetical protein [Micromonospora carbonacea]MBB5829572.1 NADPH:quinone reductase-like Zn-dependent oxidoreductase [Micromonospora carbonacea]QLD23025.1 hypothetical protein HXZ27_01175 [Micromonospora carbonacea]
MIRTPGQLDRAVNGVIDVVGGDTLVQAYGKLAESGVLVSVGHPGSAGERFPALAFGPTAALECRGICSGLATGGSKARNGTTT